MDNLADVVDQSLIEITIISVFKDLMVYQIKAIDMPGKILSLQCSNGCVYL